ncbi:FliH/SctL family protein [Exiguobacterium sp. s129]|uniref:FliH/SctL family protein n=1 Tax=Exiguobacterium sp. s129 TaxID=2751264 RepID=UPI001BEC7941|nr:FliH/SctL family protein [Exiguobacterium sp. s129]
MTSLSNVIKRQRATSHIPQRIESKRLETSIPDPTDGIDHHQVIESRYEKLRQDEEAFQQFQQTEIEQLERFKQEAYEQARLEGYEAGLLQGRQDGYAEFEDVTTRLNSVSTELEQLFQEKWKQAEIQLIDLAIAISAQVTTDLVRKDEALFAAMIQEQIAQLIDAEALTIFVHPTRLASIQRFESLWRDEETPPLKYRGDSSLDETSVRIESPHRGSEIDLSYSFERIQVKIEEVLADGAY